MNVMGAASRGQSSSGRRTAVLNLLRERGSAMEIAEIAALLDVHVNTVRFHLEALRESGQVVQSTAEPHRPGRPPQLYAAVRGMDPAGPRNYELLADILATGYAAEAGATRSPAEAGRRWGRQLVDAEATVGTAEAAIEQLVGVLAELNFVPELRAGDGLTTIGLRHCPFLELARSRAEVICPVHLGLMRGVLDASGGGVTVDQLQAFAEPDLCLTHLGRV